jgi:hypothetical protein
MDLKETGWEVWTGLMWLRIGTSGGLFEVGNELSCCIKCRQFLDELRSN